MRIRHRTPSIFNLSMVDVLCCALGCVLLLWLWNLRKAQEYQQQNDQQSLTSADVLAARDNAYQLLAELQDVHDAQHAAQQARLLAVETQLSDATLRQTLTSKDLEGLRAVLDNERKLAQEMTREKVTLQERLKALQVLVDRLPTLEKELASARDREKEATVLARGREADLLAIRDREKQAGELLRSRDADLAELARRVQALTTDKAALDRAMTALATEKNAGATDLRATQTNLNTSQTRVRELEKELATTIRTLLNLQDEKKALEAQAAKIKAATDTRFAGIELAGRRVVFLVDTSLSMIETADGKPFPEKWAGVVETVGKVMQSLPELESYQLVLFSRESSYPLSQPGEWLRYDPQASPDLVKRTLLDPKNKPDGGTNMYAGLENAFKMRANHLDTVYLFSDGLPSRGVGVDPAIGRTLSDTELARRLGDHVRRTLREDWNRPIPNLPRVRIHSIGFFYDSPDVGAFLWSLSRDNNGSFVGMSRP